MNFYQQNCEVFRKHWKGYDLIDILDNYDSKPVDIPGNMNCDEYIQHTLRFNGINHIDELRSVVVLGFEVGYFTRFLLEHCGPTTSIIVLDMDVARIKHEFESQDLSDILSDPRVIILANNTKLKLIKQLELIFSFNNFTVLSNRVYFIEQPIYNNYNPEYSKELKQVFIESRQAFLALLGNSPDDTIKGIRNIIYNIHSIIESYPLNQLENVYKDIPAICVAAGPSLEKNIGILKMLRGKALIFACDTIMDKLTKNKITPDFVSSLERDEQVYDGFYKNRIFSKDTFFVGSTLVDERIFNEFPGNKSLISPTGMPMGHWLKEALDNLTFIQLGKSVAHLNYNLARFLGCKPIILIGQDLAYGETGNTHVQGTYDENELFKNIFAQLPDLDVHNREKRFEVQGFFGKPVETNRWWDMYRRWFEESVHLEPWELINATEGGAYIDGALHMSLKEVMERYCPVELDIKWPRQLQNITTHKSHIATINRLSKKVKYLIKNNKQQQIKFENLRKKAYWLTNELNWKRSKVDVLNKIAQLDSDIRKIIFLDANLAQTIQYYVFLYKSKMNRIVELKKFQDVQTAYQHLIEFIVNCETYVKKIEDLYRRFEERLILKLE